MASGYNITQFDAPGILGLYQNTQDRRVQQMLLQRKIAAEDRDLARTESMSNIYKNLVIPGQAGTQPKGGDPSSGGMSGAYAATSAPVAPSAPLAAQPGAVAPIASAPWAPASDDPSPAATAPPAATPGAAATASPPAPLTTGDHGWLASNAGAISQLMKLDPKQAMELYAHLKGMDDGQRAALVDGQDALHQLAGAVQGIPYAQRKAAIMQAAPELMRAHPGITPDMVQNFDPTDQNIQVIIGQSLGIKGMADQAEKARAADETHRHNVADEANSANNGYLNAGLAPPGMNIDGLGGSATPATGQRYTGGWTPRARNGGDNSDAAVDGKISGAAQFLGVSPSADISHMPPLKIAQAMALSEGGAGSVADRYNNPANLRNSNGTFRQFPTKEAGLQAAAQLVQRKLASGQTTVQSMIEGLPKGGGAPSGGLRVLPGGKLDHTAGVDQATVDFYGQKIAAGGDMPSFGTGKDAAALRQAILKRSAEIQSGQGMSGGDSNLQHADVKTATTALAALQRTRNGLDPYLQTFDGASAQVRALAPKGVAGSVPIFNRWIQAGRTSVAGDPEVTKLNVAINAVANENAKIMSGASGGAVSSDSARHEAMSLINNAQTLPQLYAALDQMHTDTQIRLKSLDDRQAALRKIISGHGTGTGSPSSGWGKAQVVGH